MNSMEAHPDEGVENQDRFLTVVYRFIFEMRFFCLMLKGSKVCSRTTDDNLNIQTMYVMMRDFRNVFASPMKSIHDLLS